MPRAQRDERGCTAGYLPLAPAHQMFLEGCHESPYAKYTSYVLKSQAIMHHFVHLTDFFSDFRISFLHSKYTVGDAQSFVVEFVHLA